MSKSKLDKLLAEKAALESKIHEVEQRLSAEKGNKLASCENCHKSTAVRRLIYIQTLWYTPPSGCTEGDYWNQGEGQWVCPHCRYVNRMCDFNGQKWLEGYKRQFALVVDKHDYSVGSSLYSTCVVDKDEVEKFERKWRELYGAEIKRY